MTRVFCVNIHCQELEFVGIYYYYWEDLKVVIQQRANHRHHMLLFLREIIGINYQLLNQRIVSLLGGSIYISSFLPFSFAYSICDRFEQVLRLVWVRSRWIHIVIPRGSIIMDTNLTSLLFWSGTDYLSLLFLWISLVHPLLEMCFCIIIIIKVSLLSNYHCHQTIIVDYCCCW